MKTLGNRALRQPLERDNRGEPKERGHTTTSQSLWMTLIAAMQRCLWGTGGVVSAMTVVLFNSILSCLEREANCFGWCFSGVSPSLHILLFCLWINKALYFHCSCKGQVHSLYLSKLWKSLSCQAFASCTIMLQGTSGFMQSHSEEVILKCTMWLLLVFF